MVGKTNALETDILELYFNNTAHPNIGDASGLQPSATAGSLYVSLHTANPGEAGSQTTSECAYTNYARVAVARTSGAWPVSGNNVSNAAKVTFPKAGAASSETGRFVGIGTASSGAGNLLWYGPLTSSGASWAFATADTAGDTLTIPGHTLAVNDQIIFFAVTGSTLPGGITEGTAYFVKTVSGSAITISTTQGGSTLDITSVGAGRAVRHVPITITENVTPEFDIGDLDIFEN